MGFKLTEKKNDKLRKMAVKKTSRQTNTILSFLLKSCFDFDYQVKVFIDNLAGLSRKQTVFLSNLQDH